MLMIIKGVSIPIIVVVVCSIIIDMVVIVHTLSIVVTKMGVLQAQFSAHATITTKRSSLSHSDGITVPIIDCIRWAIVKLSTNKMFMRSAQSFVPNTITANLSPISEDTYIVIFSLIKGVWWTEILGLGRLRGFRR